MCFLVWINLNSYNNKLTGFNYHLKFCYITEYVFKKKVKYQNTKRQEKFSLN